ncbi:MAG: CarD family transcriptional regulator, partial [Phycisphaerae bacterium]
MDIFASIRADERLVRLADMIGQRRETPVIAEGLWGSCAPILAAFAAQRADRPLLLITAHADEADDFRDDIETALGRLPELLPQLENETSLARTSGAAVEEGESADDELLGERLRVCMALLDYQKQREKRASATRTRASSQLPSSSDNEAPVIVAPIYALMQPVPTPEAIANASLTLRVGDCLELDELGAWLASQGFQAADAVEHPGDFSRRGGIFDVFSAALRQPVRIEFFDDEIESIRFFEAGTQRSGETLDSIVIPARNIVAPRGSTPAQQRAHFTGFLAHLPADTIIAINEPADVQEIGRTIHQRLGERAGIMPVDAVLRRASDFTQLHLRRFASSEANAIDFAVQSLPQFEPKAEERCEALREVAESSRVMVLCENLAENQRFSELMEQLPEPIARVESAVGLLHRGFLWGATSSAQPITGTPVSHPNPVRQARGRDRNDESDSANRERPDPPLGAGGSDSVAYIPHHELFHRFRQTRTLRRVAPARAIDSFFDLKVNDYVVHVQHGIARFRGLKALERDEQRGEYLLLEFADKAHVHVPISQIHLVQKYIGSFRGKPKLSKLGGRAWKQTKDKVAESVTDLAAELLALHAQRETQPGIAYPQDTAWQREFEDAFPYNETEDQLRTLAEIKQDMTRPRPMDRLLCGDVGFGKTELAIRAAFKTIE